MPAFSAWTDPMSATDFVAAGPLDTRLRAAPTAWPSGFGLKAGGRDRTAAALRAVAKENVAINDMDKVTQQGAAMVEPLTAAHRNLLREAEALSPNMSVFRAYQTPSRGHRPAPRAQAPVAALKSVGHLGSAAARHPAPCQGADEWEQF